MVKYVLQFLYNFLYISSCLYVYSLSLIRLLTWADYYTLNSTTKQSQVPWQKHIYARYLIEGSQTAKKEKKNTA